MKTLKQSTAYNLMVLMIDSTDHIAGKTGLTLAITASKNGAAFSSITPIITDRGSGWYNLELTDAHTDTLGDLAIHITGTGADPVDISMQVVARVTDDLATTAAFTTLFNLVASIAGSGFDISTDTLEKLRELVDTLVPPSPMVLP